MNIIIGEVRCAIRTYHVVLVLNILLTEIVYSQFSEIKSLGMVQKFSFPITVNFSSLIKYSSINYFDLVFYNQDSSGIGVMRNNTHGEFIDYKFIAKTSHVSSLTVGNLNNDGIDDIVLVHRDQNQIEILMSNKNDSSFSSNFASVNFYPEKVVVADITNDEIPDIISYGKLSTGVCVIEGKGNGKFKPKKTLFDNIPVGDFSVVALNADNIKDAAVYNWLSNETILFLGFGKMKFSEQTILSFAQDSVRVFFDDYNNDALADIAISSAQNKTIQIFHGDGLGNFLSVQTIPTALSPDYIATGAFNKKYSRDIILNANSANLLSTLINKDDGYFYDEIIFGKDQRTSETIVGDLNSDGFGDVLVIGNNYKDYSVYWNSQTKDPQMQNEISLAVGLKPNNITVADLNGDGVDDIIVSNYESSTISFLISSDHIISGQLSVESPEKPYSASFYQKTDSTLMFYTTHQETPQISLFTLHKGGDSSYSVFGNIEQFSINLPGKPLTVLPDISNIQKGISLYAFMSTTNNSIVFYQQVTGTRFIAKNLVPKIQSKILDATISDLNKDGKTDLLYTYNNEQLKKCYLSVIMNDSLGGYQGRVLQFEIADSNARKAFIYIDDFNGDQIYDCVIYTTPKNTITLSLGSKENILEPFQQIAEGVNIRNLEQLQVVDFDNDGINDILYTERDNYQLKVLKGKNNGNFMPILSNTILPKETVFRCGDFNGDSLTDIVYTNPGGHTVTITYGQKH